MKFSKKVVYLILAIAFIVQLIVNSYGVYLGFVKVSGIIDFSAHIFFGTILSSFFGGILLYLDFIILRKIDRNISWEKSYLQRSLLDLLCSTAIGTAMGIFMTLLVNVFFPYNEEVLNVILRNVIITSVINILMMSGIEVYNFFRNNQLSKIQNERLQKENAIIKYETLKSQVNPHFLFNSLNVLSALIKKDPSEAQIFIDEFSALYRYVMDTLDKDVVLLKDELHFVKTYLYLQKSRFGNSLQTQIEIDAQLLDRYVPPLALQTLIENAIKHNIINETAPLKIEIRGNDNKLIIRNNLQHKKSIGESTGFGLDNLQRRYSYISETKPEFKVSDNYYLAIIPIIKPE